MDSLAKTIESIKCGQIVGLQDRVQSLLTDQSSTGAEGKQIIRYCSRYVYDHSDLPTDVFTSLLNLVGLCCRHHQEQITNDAPFHLKSMYYIILTATKRKDLHHHLTGLLTALEPFVKKCDTSQGDAQSITKSLYQLVWNVSLTLTPPPDFPKTSADKTSPDPPSTSSNPPMALTLQRFALQYCIASGTNYSMACSQALKAHSSYEHKSPQHLNKFFEAILSILFRAVQKETTISDSLVLDIFKLVMEYAKVLLQLNLCAQFNNISKSMVSLFEKACSAPIILGLKIGLKVCEGGMAHKVGKCPREMMKKLLDWASTAPKVHIPNKLIVASFLAILEMYRDKEGKSSLDESLLMCLLDALLARTEASDNEEDVRKVVTALNHHLGSYVDKLKTIDDHTKTTNDPAKTEGAQDKVLGEAVRWAAKLKALVSSTMKNKSNWTWQIYNVGINSGNVGVLGIRGRRYEAASKLFELSVEMLEIFVTLAPQHQAEVARLLLTKRLRTLSDSLRYLDHHWEAGLAAGWGLVIGVLPQQEVVNMWIKCKRDAHRAGSKTLHGVTVCEVVKEARRRHQETDNFSFNTVAALREEIKCYKNQGHNTSEDEEQCGRRLAEESKGNVCERAWGLLAVAEALKRMQQKGTAACLQALHILKEVITLLEGNKKSSEGRELMARAHFWLYLCQLQHIEMINSESEEPEKTPNSLTAQATDLGEEVQADDVCDVRPSTPGLTLHEHEASLAPLHTALALWRDLDKEGVVLSEPELTLGLLASAGYVYQVSGLTTPTVSCWATLVSFARSHNLHTFLVKGVTELLLAIPEVVSNGLVSEAVKALVKCEKEAHTSTNNTSAPQDSSLAYLTTSLHAALALRCYRIGQYNEGWTYLNQALAADSMSKQTLGSTEVQSLVHLMASHYAMLPPHLLPQSSSSKSSSSSTPCHHPPFFSATLACRLASALVRSANASPANAASSADRIECFRHRVVFLYLRTTCWLGRLCLTTAQPRVARAYLKESLALAQQFTLPMWTAKLLELLARVDLMCDQFDECRVKVDSLQTILAVHSRHQPSPIAKKTPKPCKVEAQKSSTKKTKKHQAVETFVDGLNSALDEEQWMRAEAPEYNVKTATIDPTLVVIGNEKRLPILTKPQLTASPSMSYREELSVVRVVECPRGLVGCVLCSTPLLHQLHISTAIILGLLHAAAHRPRPATICLARASQMYQAISEKASEISKGLRELLGEKEEETVDRQTSFVHSTLNQVRLRLYHSGAESLAMDGQLEEALHTSIEGLKFVTTLPTQLLIQEMHFVLVLQLQGSRLEKMITEQTKDPSSPDEVSGELSQAEDDENRKSLLKTPERLHKAPMDAFSCLKAKRNQLAVPGADDKTFNIFSDEDDSPDFLKSTRTPSPNTYKKPIWKRTRKEAATAAPSKPRTARNTKKTDDMEKISSQLGLMDLSDSPTDIILEVPKSLVKSTRKPAQRDTSSSKTPSEIMTKSSKSRIMTGRKPTEPLDNPEPLAEDHNSRAKSSRIRKPVFIINDSPESIILDIPKPWIKSVAKPASKSVSKKALVPIASPNATSSKSSSKQDSTKQRTSKDGSTRQDISKLGTAITKPRTARRENSKPESSNLETSNPEQGITRRGRQPKASKIIETKTSWTSSSSSNNDSNSSDACELFKEPKSSSSRAKMSTTRASRERGAVSRSQSREVPQVKTTGKSRASRALRML